MNNSTDGNNRWRIHALKFWGFRSPTLPSSSSPSFPPGHLIPQSQVNASLAPCPLSFYLPSLPCPLLSLRFTLPIPLFTAMRSGERCKLPQRVWGDPKPKLNLLHPILWQPE